MAAAAENSANIMKSAARGTPALLTTVASSKKRKSNGNLTNVSDKFSLDFLKDPLLLRRLSSAASLTDSFLQSNDLFLPPSHALRLESLVSSLPISPSPTTCPSAATWFHRFLTSAVKDDDPRWYLCFRMSRATFFHLFTILPTSLPSFAAAIFRLAHAASYESLVHRFGFDSTADACRSFFTVCKLILEKLGQLDDPNPDFLPRLLLNCCGVLGFQRFEVDGELLGANGSLIVQALVDSDGRFADISAGWPCTMKPEAIFRQTNLFSTVEETEGRRFLNGAPTKLGNGISFPRYILGDSCLPLLPWLMTPYNSSSSEEDESFESSSRREFNNVVYTALHTVETAFARVRARWRILDRKWKPETAEFLPFILTTGCLLHNFLVNSGEDDSPEFVNGTLPETWKVERDEEENWRSQGEAFVGSKRIRDAIAENLSQVSSIR